jgi:hypothetical protein
MIKRAQKNFLIDASLYCLGGEEVVGMARAQHQHGGCRMNVWASNDDDVDTLKYYSQFIFHLFGL